VAQQGIRSPINEPDQLGDIVKGRAELHAEVIRAWDKPLTTHGGIAVLRGNLAPDGAILKPRRRRTPALMQHRGRAVVFEDINDYKKKIADPNLDIDETCVMVLKNCGPKGYPGMAEVGNMGLPPKVLKKGITDMVRISDARMSGTAYGTVVLHTSPEAGGRRPAGAGEGRRHGRARMSAGRKLHHRGQRRGAGQAPRAMERRRSRRWRAATRSSTSTTCCRPTRAPTSISWSATAAPAFHAESH
jgi:hypothetical protein